MKIHHTRGVYNNGEFKDNGVLAEDLAAHIEYNKTYRFGRALLVDGVVVYNGYLSNEQLIPHIGVVKTYTRSTAPYR